MTSYSPTKIARALKNKGFVELKLRGKRKKHRVFVLRHEGSLLGIRTYISHTKKGNLGEDLIKAMSIELGMESLPFFKRYLACEPQTREQFNQQLQTAGKF